MGICGSGSVGPVGVYQDPYSKVVQVLEPLGLQRYANKFLSAGWGNVYLWKDLCEMDLQEMGLPHQCINQFCVRFMDKNSWETVRIKLSAIDSCLEQYWYHFIVEGWEQPSMWGRITEVEIDAMGCLRPHKLIWMEAIDGREAKVKKLDPMSLFKTDRYDDPPSFKRAIEQSVQRVSEEMSGTVDMGPFARGLGQLAMSAATSGLSNFAGVLDIASSVERMALGFSYGKHMEDDQKREVLHEETTFDGDNETTVVSAIIVASKKTESHSGKFGAFLSGETYSHTVQIKMFFFVSENESAKQVLKKLDGNFAMKLVTSAHDI